MRDPGSGSFFIQDLMRELEKCASELDLLSIVLRNQRIMENRDIYLPDEGFRKQIRDIKK